MNFYIADAVLGEKGGACDRLITAPVLSLTLDQEQCPYEWRGSIQVYQYFAIYPQRDKTAYLLGLCLAGTRDCRTHAHKILTDFVRKERLDIMQHFDGDEYV